MNSGLGFALAAFLFFWPCRAHLDANVAVQHASRVAMFDSCASVAVLGASQRPEALRVLPNVRQFVRLMYACG